MSEETSNHGTDLETQTVKHHRATSPALRMRRGRTRTCTSDHMDMAGAAPPAGPSMLLSGVQRSLCPWVFLGLELQLYIFVSTCATLLAVARRQRLRRALPSTNCPQPQGRRSPIRDLELRSHSTSSDTVQYNPRGVLKVVGPPSSHRDTPKVVRDRRLWARRASVVHTCCVRVPGQAIAAMASAASSTRAPITPHCTRGRRDRMTSCPKGCE